MGIRCLIVDDEPLALDVLEAYIERLDDLELVARLDNAVEAFNFLQKEEVDLLFLDIQMPKLTGIDLLKNISDPPQVIFTTAYRDYALQGYELNVVDYLLKPISFDRFLKAVNKVIQNQGKSDDTEPEPSGPKQEPLNYQDAYIYLKSDKKMVKVPLAEILYIESLKDYIRVFTAEKNVTAYQRISYMEEKLPSDKFARIHRSFIINLDQIDAYNTSIVEVAGKEIPIGRNYRQEVLKILNDQNLLNE
ncbi:MAG: LytTR family DNA-binding domain-containing protein [Bacteroidia bacterium]|nr:LytTR family DNA-binding domain-containing protein [Bacteroidia bacterium]